MIKQSKKKLFRSGYGDPYNFDVPIGLKQLKRRKILQKQVYGARRNYGIRFEYASKQETKAEKNEGWSHL